MDSIVERIDGTDSGSDDGNNLCRVCLSANDDNKCIFTSNMKREDSTKDSTEIFDKLFIYGGIKVSQNDGLPGKICDKCISDMYAAHEFRTRCQATDKILRMSIPINAAVNNNYSTLASSEKSLQDGKRMKLRNDCYNQVHNSVAVDSGNGRSAPKDAGNKISLCTNEANVHELMDFEFMKVESIEKTTATISSTEFESDNNANSIGGIQDVDDRTNFEKLTSKKDGHRTQRIALFRKTTSMTHLRNSKERQRQYMKKTRSTVIDSAELDKTKHDKMPSSYTRSGASASRQIAPVHMDDKIIENPMEKLEPASCNICNKNFRKVVTLVRHLNVHKKDNPRAVYSILKNMRDAATTRGQRAKTANETDPGSSHNYDDNRDADNDRSTIKLINMWMKEQLGPDTRARMFSCNDCDKFYAMKKSLLNHRNKIHGYTIKENCSRCRVSQCVCDDATNIVDNKDMSDKKKKYTCSECDKTFDKEGKLHKHARIHLREKEQNDVDFKRFLCHICSKTYRQNTGLIFHMRTHTGYKPHICKYCGRGFTSKSNCINHERTHTGDRPFICHFCSAAFAKSCTLKSHITTHTGEANYHCKTCGKSFRRLKYLKEHRFTHTGEKPYACKICGTAYSHSGSLFVHEKKCKSQNEMNHRLPAMLSSPSKCHHTSLR